MAKMLPKLNASLQEFIRAQQMFFVATADVDGRVNLSPKGLDSLRILSPQRLLWLNLTGSGNETAAHLLSTNRMTLMFCAFANNPLILRVYGHARTIHPDHPEWPELYARFPDLAGARQIFDVEIESVQTSCGYAVPLYDFVGQRSRLIESFEKRGPAKTQEYWLEKNALSIDGKPTGINRPLERE